MTVLLLNVSECTASELHELFLSIVGLERPVGKGEESAKETKPDAKILTACCEFLQQTSIDIGDWLAHAEFDKWASEEEQLRDIGFVHDESIAECIEIFGAEATEYVLSRRDPSFCVSC